MPDRAATALTPRLRCAEGPTADRAVLTVESDHGPVPFVAEVRTGRLQLGLVMPHRERPLDVSREPAALVSALASTDDSDDDRAAAARWVRAFCRSHGLFTAERPDIERGVTGAAFPLLGQIYALGAGTLTSVPVWADPLLAEAHVRDGARAVLGTAATRTVVAALGSALSATEPEAPPSIAPLALALMGAVVLSPDALARVIRAASPPPGRSAHALPTVDDIGRFRAVSGWLGHRRAERLLVDAGRTDDGIQLLQRTTALLVGLPAGAWDGLPAGLGQLHERCVALTPRDPQPTPARPPVAAPRVQPRPGRAAAPPRHALAPPGASGRAVRPVDALRYPPNVARLHGRSLSDQLRLVLPRTPGELSSWGWLLHNCLGSYATAVASGTSLVIGIERGDVLAYCIEVTPGSRTIRQFHGSHNRPVPTRTCATVCRALVAAGVVDRHHRANAPWIDLCSVEN